MGLRVTDRRISASPAFRAAGFGVARPVLATAGLLLALVAAPPESHGHALAPAYLELHELGGGAVEVRWRVSRLVPRGAPELDPRLPCPPAAGGGADVREEPTAWTARWTLRCDGPLAGREIAVDGLASSATDALVRVRLADGRESSAILSGRAPRFRIPERQGALEVAGRYLALGVEHLATGLDHVLFVTGLLLLLGGGRRLLVAITSFTAGHSVTLALALLGVARVPQGAVEVGIAASLVALALELARRDGRARSPFHRHPAALPLAFGLLHGLGFAGALAAIGVPGDAVPLALASFNLGIELGQLALVAAVLPLQVAGRALAARGLPARVEHLAAELPATAIGALGVFWCLERTLGGLLGPF